MNFGRGSLDDRYKNDTTFHRLVDQLEQYIVTNGFTPSEMREALFLAHYKYEMNNPAMVRADVGQRVEDFLALYGSDITRNVQPTSKDSI